MSCKRIERLFALPSQLLSAEETEQIRLHVAGGCRECRHWLDQFEKVSSTANPSTLARPPAWLIRQTLNLFDWKKANALPENVERVPAFLLVDSFTGGQAMGFRSVSATSRQMLYQAGGYNINLSLSAAEPTPMVNIMGQPMPLSPSAEVIAGVEVLLKKGSSIASAAKSNEFGAFIFCSVPEGIYDLTIRLTNEELGIIALPATVSSH